MAGETFEHVSVVVADRDQTSRRQVRATLISAGFKKIRTGDSLAFVRDCCLTDMPDLLISETQLGDGNFAKFITALRHNEFGHNPFLVISALTANPTPELVRAVIDAGSDDLLTKPVSQDVLVNRLGKLIHQRKPFVVTSDYVGPVRPAKSQYEAGAEKFEAPNTLRAKATGTTVDISETQKMIDQAIKKVNTQKLESHGAQIPELVTMVIPRLSADRLDATAKLCLDRLIYVAEDTSRRLGGTKYDHVSELASSLLKVSVAIRNVDGRPSDQHVRLLGPLSQAIQLGFAKGADVNAARQISDAVNAKQAS